MKKQTLLIVLLAFMCAHTEVGNQLDQLKGNFIKKISFCVVLLAHWAQEAKVLCNREMSRRALVLPFVLAALSVDSPTSCRFNSEASYLTHAPCESTGNVTCYH